MPFSISAGIGFIALFGVAVLNGIVLIEHLKDLKKQGITDMRERILKGTRERLRPVLLTAGAAALGFLPMAISNSAGAEVQRPLATVVIGGLVTSTLLTMLALPLLYAVVDGITGMQVWPPKFKRKVLPVLIVLVLPAISYAQSSGKLTETTVPLSLSEVLEIAYRSNSELEAFRLKAEEQKALIRTAYSIDKTSIYYSYDENNIADNGYPIGVIGGEQRFDFPTLYFAKKDAYTYAYEMALNEYEVRKRKLTREISKNYHYLLYLETRLRTYAKVDSLYSRFSTSANQSYSAGAISYLELLNAQSIQQEVRLLENQMLHDIRIAYKNLSTLMQYDSLFVLHSDSMTRLTVRADSSRSDPGFSYLQNAAFRQSAELKVEKQSLLPELTLSYFNGTNRYEGARHYQGVELGLGIPIFFSEQRAKVKAKQYALQASSLFQSYYLSRYENRMTELENGLLKYQEALDYYEKKGQVLAEEIIRSAELSYSAGEIDFFQYTQSVERAVEIVLNYLDNLYRYNELVLDMNYLTIEN
jgi:cobalt-zinc-cadmium resistance protein CzcA